MHRASVGDFDEDEEVRSYMRDKIKNDICLCKKYADKRINGKVCPLCCDNISEGEPKMKQRKRSRIPRGNYGRTGSLAKPDLLTIPETEFSNRVPEELLKRVVIKANFRDNSSIIKVNECRNCEIAHDVNCKGNKESKSLINEDPRTSSERLVSESYKNRISTHDTVEEYGTLNKSMVNCNDLRMTYNKVSDCSCSLKESGNQAKRTMPIDNEIIMSDQNEISSIRKQKPVLIPAHEFIGRYLRSSGVTISQAKNKAQGLEASNLYTESHVSDERDSVYNKTDDEKMIEGLSHISINNDSNQNLTDNEKRCFQ